MKKLIAIIGFIFASLFLIACGSEINDSSVPYVDDIIHTEDHDVENETCLLIMRRVWVAIQKIITGAGIVRRHLMKMVQK